MRVKKFCNTCGGDGLIVADWNDDDYENIEEDCPDCLLRWNKIGKKTWILKAEAGTGAVIYKPNGSGYFILVLYVEYRQVLKICYKLLRACKTEAEKEIVKYL